MNTVITYRDQRPFLPGPEPSADPAGPTEQPLGDTGHGLTTQKLLQRESRRTVAEGGEMPTSGSPVVPDFPEQGLPGFQEAAEPRRTRRAVSVGEPGSEDVRPAPEVELQGSFDGSEVPARRAGLAPETPRRRKAVELVEGQAPPESPTSPSGGGSGARQPNEASQQVRTDLGRLEERGFRESARRLFETGEASSEPQPQVELSGLRDNPHVTSPASRRESGSTESSQPSDPTGLVDAYSGGSRRDISQDKTDRAPALSQGESPPPGVPGSPAGRRDTWRLSRDPLSLADPPDTEAEDGMGVGGVSPAANHRTTPPKAFEKSKDEQPSSQPRRMTLTGSLQIVNGNGQGIGTGAVRMEAR